MTRFNGKKLLFFFFYISDVRFENKYFKTTYVHRGIKKQKSLKEIRLNFQIIQNRLLRMYNRRICDQIFYIVYIPMSTIN